VLLGSAVGCALATLVGGGIYSLASTGDLPTLHAQQALAKSPAHSATQPAPFSAASVRAPTSAEDAVTKPAPKPKLPPVKGIPWNAPTAKKTGSCRFLVGAEGQGPRVHLLKQALARGEAELSRGNLDEAQMAYCEAKVLGDTSSTVLLTLAQIQLLQHDPEGALEVVDEMLNRKPDDPDALDLRGDALIRMGRITEARTDWFRAVGAARESELVLGNLLLANRAAASSALEQDDLVLADRTLRRVIALDPQDARAAAELASVLFKRGLERAAWRWLAYAVSLDGAHPRVQAVRERMGG
jgi:Flp pilus assembly protein TadD